MAMMLKDTHEIIKVLQARCIFNNSTAMTTLDAFGGCFVRVYPSASIPSALFEKETDVEKDSINKFSLSNVAASDSSLRKGREGKRICRRWWYRKHSFP
jgi:hypothetical protein